MKVSFRCGCRPKARQTLRCHGLAHADPASHVACRPVGRTHRLLRERDHPLDRLATDIARRSAARRIHRAVQPVRHEALPPGDRVLAADPGCAVIALVVYGSAPSASTIRPTSGTKKIAKL